MLSMPPATITSASPSWMAWAASTTAFSPEPQALFTVKLGTSFGTPPSSAATRPGLRPSPAGSTWPRITSSTCAGSRRARRMASRPTTLPRRLGRPVRFQILTGTSVGAIHACYVAATLGRPDAGRGLIDIWRSLQVGGVYNVGVGDVVGIPLRLLGLTRQRKTPPEGAIPERLTGLLDTLPLERLVRESIPWANLRHRVETGEIDAIAVAAT